MSDLNTGSAAASALSAIGTSSWPSVLANVGAVGVICWLVVSQMPAMQENFSKELSAIRESYREDMALEREARTKEVDRLSTSLDKLAEAIRNGKIQ